MRLISFDVIRVRGDTATLFDICSALNHARVDALAVWLYFIFIGFYFYHEPSLTR